MNVVFVFQSGNENERCFCVPEWQWEWTLFLCSRVAMRMNVVFVFQSGNEDERCFCVPEWQWEWTLFLCSRVAMRMNVVFVFQSGNENERCFCVPELQWGWTLFLCSRVAMRMNVVAVKKMLQLCYKLPKLEVMFCFRMTRHDVLQNSIDSLNSVIMLLNTIHKIQTYHYLPTMQIIIWDMAICCKIHIMAPKWFTKRTEMNIDTFWSTCILCTTVPADTVSLLVRPDDCAYVAGPGARVDGVRLLRQTLHRRECLWSARPPG